MPFLPLHPTVYAELLGRKLAAHPATVWLVNTGWSGGSYGIGQRMDLGYTRALVRAVLENRLADVSFRPEPMFGLWIPDAVPGVPAEVLDPRVSWADKAAYDAQARKLARLFVENFETYRAGASPEVIAATPTG
jgi:phosphoenolpyruvate carboxykinase (ATP)